MNTYKCTNCTFTFSDADKSYDVAISTGMCPECKTLLENFDSRVSSINIIPEKQAINGDTVVSILVRLVAGALGILLFYGFFAMLLNGVVPSNQPIKILFGMPVLAVAFIAYAIGGQKLLRKVVPFMAEKDPK